MSMLRQFLKSYSVKIFRVNGERYRVMLKEFLFSKIEEVGMDDIRFQQDGATCHTANVTIDLLRTVFENRIISQNSHVNWPPRSCDLTPLDYFFWRAVKDKCYTNHPETIETLKHKILNVILLREGYKFVDMTIRCIAIVTKILCLL